MTYFSYDDLQNFTHVPSLIFAKLDDANVVLSINDEIKNVLGWEPEEVIGHAITEYFSPDDLKSFSFLPSVQQSRFKHKDGHWVWINWLARKFQDHYYLVGRGISRVQEHDERVRLTTERLALAVKISEVGIFEWDPSTNAISFDPIIEKIYGFGPGTMPQTILPLNELNHPDDVPHILAGVEKALAERSLFSNEHRLYRRNGELRWVKCWIQPVEGFDKSIRVIGTMLDITDEKKTADEQKLLAQISEILTSSFDYVKNIETVLSLLVKNGCDIAVLDHIDEEKMALDRIMARKNPQTGIIEMSTKATRFEHFPVHPITDKLFAGEVVHIQDADAFISEISPLLSREFIESVHLKTTKSMLFTLLKRQDRLLGILVLATEKGNPQEFHERDMRFLKDVSYRISMAVENSMLYIRSQEAVRTRDEFLSIASHELKTPLQTLTLQNDMLARQFERRPQDKANPELVRKFLESDRRQLKRITRLIEDMLDITRIQNAQFRIEKERFDFATLLRDLVDQMRPAFDEEKMDVSLKVDQSLVIEADSFRIEQVITNILTNALKYGNKKPVEIIAVRENDRLKFSVTDHGPGISKEDQKRIFQRFSRAISRLQSSGLGLGLYICQKIVEAHGGEIHIQSEIDKGSTFTVYLPLP